MFFIAFLLMTNTTKTQSIQQSMCDAQNSRHRTVIAGIQRGGEERHSADECPTCLLAAPLSV
jgi:hypothetical protein